MTAILIRTALVTGALICAVLLARRPVARAFGAQAAYALWALPLLRLVLPPLTLPAAMAPAAEPAAALTTSLAVTGSAALPAPLAAAPAGPDWQAAATALWLGGAVLFLLWRAAAYARMRRMLLAEARSVGEAGAVRLIETPMVSAPVAFGLFDKVIALPPGFMALADRGARDLALAHELAHHARRDLLANIAAQPLLALHWFNPLAWAGWRAMRRDQEAACDARVLAGRGDGERADYARLIAGFAGGPRLAMAAPMACPVLGEKSIIHRLRSLTMPQPTERRRRMARVLTITAALALPLTASISYATDEPPAPPAAPEAPAAPIAKHEQRVIIIENKGPEDGQGKRFTRTVVRDGKTITLTTAHELTDAEFETRLAEIERNLPVPPVPPVAGAEPPAPPAPPAAPQMETRRVIIRSGPAGETVDVIGAEALATCADGSQPVAVKADSNEGGQRRVYAMRICTRGQPGHEAAAALGGIKAARERVASDARMPADVREKVLAQLDAEIERLSKGG